MLLRSLAKSEVNLHRLGSELVWQDWKLFPADPVKVPWSIAPNLDELLGPLPTEGNGMIPHFDDHGYLPPGCERQLHDRRSGAQRCRLRLAHEC